MWANNSVWSFRANGDMPFENRNKFLRLIFGFFALRTEKKSKFSAALSNGKCIFYFQNTFFNCVLFRLPPFTVKFEKKNNELIQSKINENCVQKEKRYQLFKLKSNVFSHLLHRNLRQHPRLQCRLTLICPNF